MRRGACFDLGVGGEGRARARARARVRAREGKQGKDVSSDGLGDKERERGVASRRGLRKFKNAGENAQKEAKKA